MDTKSDNDMDTQFSCIRLRNFHVILITCPEISREVLRKQNSVFITEPTSTCAEFASKGYLATIPSPFGEQWNKMKRIMLK